MMKTTTPLVAFSAAVIVAAAMGEPLIPPAKQASKEAAQLKLMFQAYDGDPADPKNMSFMVVVGLGQSSFLQLGQTIANTPYRLESFSAKTRKDPKTNLEENVSELTLTHTGTKKSVALTIGVPVLVKPE